MKKRAKRLDPVPEYFIRKFRIDIIIIFLLSWVMKEELNSSNVPLALSKKDNS